MTVFLAMEIIQLISTMFLVIVVALVVMCARSKLRVSFGSVRAGQCFCLCLLVFACFCFRFCLWVLAFAFVLTGFPFVLFLFNRAARSAPGLVFGMVETKQQQRKTQAQRKKQTGKTTETQRNEQQQPLKVQ